LRNNMIKAVILILLSIFAVQSPQTPVSALVPVGSEGHHHFKLENEYARVFDVLVPPGDSTLYHIHSNDYAYVSLSNVSLKAQILGAQPIDLILRNGEVRYTRGPITHMVSNPDATPFRNITVEILKPAPRGTGSVLATPSVLGTPSGSDRLQATGTGSALGTPSPLGTPTGSDRLPATSTARPQATSTGSVLGTPSGSDRVQAAELPKLAHHVVELENDRVRILRVILEPGQSTGIHTHVLPHLRVAVSAARVMYDSPGTRAETRDSKPGDFVWNPSKTAQDLKNVGSARFEAVEIEFK
jgi:quercetin dioxygenase-like cupin family protein